MPRHSKNNTAGSFFTAHEKQQLKEYGTQTKRLGKDSFRNFDCCSLCLNTLQDPQSCQKGHLYCKECIFENLLTQKKNIKRDKKLYNKYLAKLQSEKEEALKEKKAAEIAAFDKLECGVLNTTSETKSDDISEKEIQSKKFNAFWMPSMTPDAEKGMKKPSSTPKCPEGNHPLKLKHLISIKFTPAKEGGNFQCPVCNKNFTNATKAMLLKSCGHVVCNSCWTRVIKDSHACYECQSGFTDEDIVQLQSGGTGFAGHHGESLTAKKLTPAAWV